MKNFIPFFLAIVLFCVFSAAAQTPTPSPEPEDDGQVVRISTSLVRIDVTVTDEDGEPVTDLRRDEIEIFQNGKKQDITNFSFVSGDSKGDIGVDQLPTGISIKRGVRPESVHRTIAIVVDDLTVSFSSMYWVRKAVRKFIDEQMQDGDLVAIIRTGAGVGALQQFTMDKRQLMAAADKIKYNQYNGRNMNIFNPTLRDGGPDAGQRNSYEANRFRENVFAAGSLGALNYVIRGMRDLPGRKSVVLLSEGIPMVLADKSGMPRPTGIGAAIRRLTDLANRASVVIYGIDPVGLEPPEIMGTGIMGEQTTRVGRNEITLIPAYPNAFDGRFAQTRQDSLKLLSEQTGGIAFINQNNINKSLGRVLNDQSYYLVGYEPDEGTFDPKLPKYNQFQVKVTRPNTEVRYRRGFLGLNEKDIKKVTLTPTQRIVNALTSPFALNEITTTLNTIIGFDEKKNPVLHPLIYIGPGGVTFEKQANNEYKASFDLVAMTFGDNGSVVDELSKAFTVTVSEADHADIEKKGFVYDFKLPLRSPGAYQVRSVIRDHVSDKIGSANEFVDVPNIKKGMLTFSTPVIDNLTKANFQKAKNGEKPDDEGFVPALYATALRQFKADSVLRFSFSIFNAKTGKTGKPNLTYKASLFCNGKLISSGTKQPFVIKNDHDKGSMDVNGMLTLPADLLPGDYILQLTIDDEQRKGKKGIGDQFIQFEIVE